MVYPETRRALMRIWGSDCGFDFDIVSEVLDAAHQARGGAGLFVAVGASSVPSSPHFLTLFLSASARQVESATCVSVKIFREKSPALGRPNDHLEFSPGPPRRCVRSRVPDVPTTVSQDCGTEHLSRTPCTLVRQSGRIIIIGGPCLHRQLVSCR